MAIFNPSGQTAQQVISNVTNKLAALRAAFNGISELYAWSSGISSADLQAAPFNLTAGDAVTLLSAINDAHAEYMIRTTGQPPGTYPQAASSYVYMATQAQVIGSQ